MALALLIPIQAFWVGCAAFDEDLEPSPDPMHAQPPAPPVAVQVAQDQDLQVVVTPPKPAPGSTIEECILPADNAWVKLARMRNIQWPMVRNWGVCHLYEVQDGLASFYHEPQAVASGGKYNPDGLTAAHKTLPFGTIVRCTRTDTNESIVVIVNDRGPYKEGRIIDLSQKAARTIHQVNDGVVPIRIEVLAYPLIETMGPEGNG